MSPLDDQTFVDRRKIPEDLRSVMSRELEELNKRRDDNLKSKLEAVEKFSNLSINTRADALSIAISRVQGDNTACAQRCYRQVAEFYTLINNLEKDYVREFEKFKAHEATSEKSFYDVAFELKAGVARSARHRKELDAKIDSLIKELETSHSTLEKRVVVLEKWRDLDWKQTLIYGACALVGLSQALTWLQKLINHD